MVLRLCLYFSVTTTKATNFTWFLRLRLYISVAKRGYTASILIKNSFRQYSDDKTCVNQVSVEENVATEQQSRSQQVSSLAHNNT